MGNPIQNGNAAHSPELTQYTDYKKPWPLLLIGGLFFVGSVGAAVYYVNSNKSKDKIVTTYSTTDSYGDDLYNYAQEPVVEIPDNRVVVQQTEVAAQPQPEAEEEEPEPFVFYQKGSGGGGASQSNDQQDKPPQTSTERVIDFIERNIAAPSSIEQPGQTGEQPGNSVAREVNGSLERLSAGLSSNFQRVYPYKEANLSNVILAGHTVSAVMDVAIDSSLPGLVKAWTTDNTFSADGKRLLIPKSSLIVGRYRSALVRGDTRVFIVWNRIQMPGGQMVEIDSPSVDEIGRSGMTGDVDRRFFERFGGAILLSIIEGYIDHESDQDGASDTVVNIGDNFQSLASQALRETINLPPIVRVPQGKLFYIMINKDIDFTSVL